MVAHVNEFVGEQRKALAEQLHRLREEPVEMLREVVGMSADGVKSLKKPVRTVTHSSLRLATVSERALRELIELESEVVTSALTAAAARLERVAKAESMVDLFLDQIEMLRATRERLIEQASRAVEIISHAGRDVRTVGMHLYDKVVEPVEEEPPKARRRARKARPAASKAAAHLH